MISVKHNLLLGDISGGLRVLITDLYTKEHIDNITKDQRNVSIILGLNSDYEKGEFHFPLQDFSTTVKRGEAIVFPVYFMYPHSVEKIEKGSRWSIVTWLM